MADFAERTPSAERVHRLSLEALRQEYRLGGLTERSCETNPIVQFQLWIRQAQTADLKEPNAMTLSTATPEGQPSARIVLLKEVSETGFVFYTNYNSRKSKECETNPRAALTFYWAELERQVRVEGSVRRVSREQSEAYFRSRPRGSRLGAWASEQSQILPNRELLERKLMDLEERYSGTEDIPTPEFWGGYCLTPEEIEFWQGRRNRLHDRLRYRREGEDAWLVERLSP